MFPGALGQISVAYPCQTTRGQISAVGEGGVLPCLAAWARLLRHIYLQQLKVKLPRLGGEGGVLLCLAAWARLLWHIHLQQLQVKLQRIGGEGNALPCLVPWANLTSNCNGLCCLAWRLGCDCRGTFISKIWKSSCHGLADRWRVSLRCQTREPIGRAIAPKPRPRDFQLLEVDMPQQSRPSREAREHTTHSSKPLQFYL